MRGTRERLLAAATELFARRGFAATTIRDIADRAGCNLALIKHYFGSKEGLLRETVRAGMRDTAAGLEAMAAAEPRYALHGAIDLLFATFDEARDGGLPIVVQELMRTDSPLAAELQPLVLANVERIARLFERARDRGQLRELDPEILAVLLVGMLQIYFISRPVADELLGPRTPELLDALREHAFEVFSRGALRARRK